MTLAENVQCIQPFVDSFVSVDALTSNYPPHLPLCLSLTENLQFEGVEKRIVLEFTQACLKQAGLESLRQIPEFIWSNILNAVVCLILSRIHSEDTKNSKSCLNHEQPHGLQSQGCTAFLLSESSLLVHDTRITLKTCGSTTLLLFVPEFLQFMMFLTNEIYQNQESVETLFLKYSTLDRVPLSAEPQTYSLDISTFVEKNVTLAIFSHMTYKFQNQQKAPHLSFECEQTFFKRFFSDCEVVRLPISVNEEFVMCFATPAMHLDSVKSSDQEHLCLTEFIMMGIDTESTFTFSGVSDVNQLGKKYGYGSSKCISEKTGAISKILPSDSMIDEYWFAPHGYSCNALNGKEYLTVHVSPEPQTSFASFETSIQCVNKGTSFMSQKAHILEDMSYTCLNAFSPRDFHVVMISVLPQQRFEWPPYFLHLLSQNYSLDRHMYICGRGFEVLHCHLMRHDNNYRGPLCISKPLSSSQLEKPCESTDAISKSIHITATFPRCFDMAIKDIYQILSGPCDLSKAEFDSVLFQERNLSLETLSHVVPSQCIILEQKILRDYISKNNPDYPIMLIDLGRVVEQCKLWYACLPTVQPYYAVKCNDDPMLIETLALLGVKFDCASITEMENIHPYVLKYSSTSDSPIQKMEKNVIFSNPCKQVTTLRAAKKLGVRWLVFDNVEELHKISAYYPDSYNLLRIRTDDADSQCPMSSKFGASLNCFDVLLKTVKKLGINFVGVSFHVGSGCRRLGVFESAIKTARDVFDKAALLGIQLKLLDIGGGFPAFNQTCSEHPSFEQLADEIQRSLDLWFPPSMGVSVISEPGRFFASLSHTLAVKIFSRRLPTNFSTTDKPTLSENEVITSECQSLMTSNGTFKSEYNGTPGDSRFLYYVNDGVYGSFNCIIYDHALIYPEPLIPLPYERFSRKCLEVHSKHMESGEKLVNPIKSYPSSLFGQTCDGYDCIFSEIELPEMRINDWIIFRNMGAYTTSASSNFNGFQRPFRKYVQILYGGNTDAAQ